MPDDVNDRERLTDFLRAAERARSHIRNGQTIRAIKELDRVIAIERAVLDAEVRFAGVTWPCPPTTSPTS